MGTEEHKVISTTAYDLRLAARSGDHDEIKKILNKLDKTSIIQTLSSVDDLSGNTALHLCCANGHVGIVNTLLDGGVPVNAKNRSGSTPLHYAALTGQLDVVKILLENCHAAPCVENDFKRTAMDEALSGRHEPVVNYLKFFIETHSSNNSVEEEEGEDEGKRMEKLMKSKIKIDDQSQLEA